VYYNFKSLISFLSLFVLLLFGYSWAIAINLHFIRHLDMSSWCYFCNSSLGRRRCGNSSSTKGYAGGGGGGAYSIRNVAVTGTTYTITVGSGG
jgi:hypothetical protein